MTKKLCTYAGCTIVVNHCNDGTSPRCRDHTAKEYSKDRKSKYNHHTDESGKDLYQSQRWKRTRKAHLLMHPFCVRCLSFNISTLARVVDHIVEVKDGGDFWDMNNLQSLCKTHHNTKTGEEKKKRRPKSEYPSLSDF